LLGGDTFELSELDDPRKIVMDWLKSKDNPYFAKAFVNRVWASYFNRGIVEPPDDLSLANPPINKALFDFLAAGFIEKNFDMKWVHRTITNSRTYQLSWQPNETNKNDQENFSRAVPRRLPAEVAYDAIQMACLSDERAAAFRDELDGRAISIPGASARNANNGPSYALSVFGKSLRESNCDCDRSDEASLLQTVFLQNDRDTLAMLERRGGWVDQIARELKLNQNGSRPSNANANAKRPENFDQLIAQMQSRIKQLRQGGDDKAAEKLQQKLANYRRRFGDVRPANSGAEKVELPKEELDSLASQAYLRTLSRYPNDQELERSVEFIKDSDDTLNGVRGLLWALVNTKEFIVNH
jgi:hypothetical protein